VWSGTRALSKGLIDVVGGLHEAVALAKQAAGIAQEDRVTVVEVSRTATSPLALLAGGGASASTGLLLAGMAAALGRGASPAAALQGAVGMSAVQQLSAAAAGGPLGLNPEALLSLFMGLQQGQALAFDVDACSLTKVGGSSAVVVGGGGSGGASFFEEGDGVGSVLAAADAYITEALEEWVL